MQLYNKEIAFHSDIDGYIEYTVLYLKFLKCQLKKHNTLTVKMGLDLDIPNKIKYYIQEKAWCDKKCTMLMLEDWF